MKIKKFLKYSITFLISFTLAFKLVFMISPNFEPIEIAELQSDNKFSRICRFGNNDLFDLNEKPLREIIFSKNSFCNTYWINNSMRGFYAHHYLALSNANLQNKNLFNNIVHIFNHQYGAITQIIPLTLIILNNNLNVQIFSALSFAIGSFLNLFVINYGKKKNILSEDQYLFTSIIFLLSVLITNVGQFLVSPGFSSLRIFPIMILLLLFLGIEGGKIQFNKLSNYVLCLITFIFLSPQFEILIFSGLGSSLLISNYLSKNANEPLKNNLLVRTSKLKKVLCIASISIFLKLFGLFLTGDISQIFLSSSADTTLHKKAFLIYSILYAGLWILFGFHSRSTRFNKENIENKLNFSSPLLTIPILLFLYPAKFWGSQNHFTIYLVANSIGFGILVMNIIKFNISNYFEYIDKYQHPINRYLNKIYFKITTIKKESFFLKEKNLSNIIRYLFIIFSYFSLSIGSLAVRSYSKIIKNEYLYVRGLKVNKFTKSASDIKSFCSAKELEISPFSINSCSVSDFDLLSHKVKLSNKNNLSEKNKKIFYLSDNDFLLRKNDLYNFVPAGYLSPLLGKNEINNNPQIKLAFEKSFNRMAKFYNEKKLEISNEFKENNDNFLENNIYQLMNDLFSDSYPSASKIDLKNKSIVIDNNLQDEISQLYIFAYGTWIEYGKNLDSQIVQEVSSKIYKYLWRLYLIKNRVDPSYSLENNIKFNDIKF